MGYTQDLSKLETTSAQRISLQVDLKGRTRFVRGEFLVITSSFEDFQTEEGNASLYFMGRLQNDIDPTVFQTAVAAESFCSPQVIRHRLRACAIQHGCQPLMQIQDGIHVQALNVGFHFHPDQLKNFRLIPFGEKITAWMRGDPFEDVECEPVVKEPVLPEAPSA